jgi:hypothetical protein
MKKGYSFSFANDDDGGLFSKLSKNTMIRRLGTTIVREVSRGLLGVLGLKAPTTRRRRRRTRARRWY